MKNSIIDNKYKIIKQIGKGGFGTVYLAEHLLLKKQLALKVIDKTSNKIHTKRILKESEVIKGISHPHVVKFHDFFQYNNHYIFSMDYIEGNSLEEEIKKKGPLSAQMHYNTL